MLSIKKAKELPNGVHKLERGVYLRVSGDSRRFIFKYQMAGKRREIGLGPLEGQTITGVLGKVARMRALIAEGKDPHVSDKPAVAKVTEEKVTCPTLKEFAPQALEHIYFLHQWKDKRKRLAVLEVLLRKHIFPVLGDTPVNQIDTDKVFHFLRALWQDKTDLAIRCQQLLKMMLGVAVREGLVKTNPAVWAGNLDALLPAPAKMVREEKHHAAVSPEELRGVVARLRQIPSKQAKLLLFGILTVGRYSEYAGGQWSEIDFAQDTFSVPPKRRKDCKPYPFVVPLSKQAQEILEALPREGNFIFALSRDITPERSTPKRMLKGTTDQPITIHGCRSTFSDWCAQNNKNFLVSEKCLMHAVGNQVFRAYQRDDLLEQRRQLLQEWADYLYNEKQPTLSPA